MIILDTSVWIEFLKKNPAYFTTISKMLELKDVLAVENDEWELYSLWHCR